MLVVGYVMGIRSGRRLRQDVHLNLACRWFCRPGLDDKVPDHSTFPRYRSPELSRAAGNRAAREYLETLDDAASGAASESQQKFVAKSDPAAQWTRAEESRPYLARLACVRIPQTWAIDRQAPASGSGAGKAGGRFQCVEFGRRHTGRASDRQSGVPHALTLTSGCASGSQDGRRAGPR
jgi:hypothetical protein